MIEVLRAEMRGDSQIITALLGGAFAAKFRTHSS